MPVYTYKAKDKFGESVSGALEGADEVSVANSLDRLGYSVVEITLQEERAFFPGEFFNLFQRVKKQEVIVFTRQLATLARTGMALSPALATICAQTENKKFNAILNDVQRSVQAGVSFSEALSKHPQVFPELFVSMVEVGETAGILDNVLDRLAVLGAQELETQSRIKSALIYPAVLVIIAFLVVNFLIVGVLPKFVTVFSSSGAKLPVPTQIIIALSWMLRNLWFPLLAVFGLAGLLFNGYIKKPERKLKFHSWLLTLPIFGSLYTKIQIFRFARTLSALTSSGIPILQGLAVVEKTVPNIAIKKVIQDIRSSITEGQPLVEPFKASGFFSPMVVQMVSTGEKTGKLDQMLEEIALFYEPEIEYTIKNLTTLLEPFMLLTMGAMVVFIALSVLLPIFNLIKVFRG